MDYQYLSETAKIKKVSETEKEGVFEIEGLYPGYGTTIGNTLRRVLLSSLPGVAVTQIKIKGVKHEFSAIDGVKEDIIEIILNVKKIRFRFYASEPQILVLKTKGEQKVCAGDIEKNPEAEIVNSDLHLLSLTSKNSEIEMEFTVEKGLGYVPAESRKSEKLPVGVIAIDAFFTPVVNVNFTIENMRVGERTDYNRLKLFITTDGSVTPSMALHKATNILKDYVAKISEIEVLEIKKSEKEEKPKKEAKKKAEKKPAKAKAKK